MKNVAIVPIRSGSKRVVDKNIRLINGKPLVFYLIDTLSSIRSIDRIIVSTDSSQYVDLIDQTYRDKIIIHKRDTNISGDLATLESCIISIISKGLCHGYDNIVLSQATSPLTNSGSIIKGIQLLNNEKYNSVVSCTEFSNFFIDDIDRMKARPRTQDMDKRYIETGCFWVFRIKEFLAEKNRIIQPITFVEVSKTEALDIDTEEDLFIVESVIKNKKKGPFFKSRICTEEDEKYSHSVIREDPDGNIRDHSIEFRKKYEFYKDEIRYINSIVKPNKKFLDLGCGRGFVLDSIDQQYDVYALEVNNGYYTSIKENVPVENIYIGELDDEVYEKDFFDVIFCGHVIEHVKNPISFLKNVNNILKRHGEFIISTPDFDSFISKRFGKNFRMLHDKTHISLFGDKKLDELLDTLGFFVDRTEKPFFNTEYFTQENVLRLFDIGEISPPFYGNILTKYCRKK